MSKVTLTLHEENSGQFNPSIALFSGISHNHAKTTISQLI
jgi:hypothetical protein